MTKISLISTAFKSAIIAAVLYVWHGLISRINRIFNRFSQDSNRIIASRNVIDPAQYEWAVNYALLREALNTSKPSNETVEKTKFLAAHYLYKNAPRPTPMRKLFSKLGSHFQESGVINAEDTYHRVALYKLTNLGASLNQEYALKDKAPLILTDTLEYKHLLPLKFAALTDASIDSLEKPILIDMTDQFGPLITGSAQFEPAFERFKQELKITIEAAVNRKCHNNPELNPSLITKLIYYNITCICDLKTKNATGIKVLPLTESQIGKVPDALSAFVIATGIGMGSVPFRRLLIKDFHTDAAISFEVGNSAKSLIVAPLYKAPSDLLKTQTYKDFEKVIGPTAPAATQLFGKFICNLLSGLLEKVSLEKWNELHQNEAEGQIVQLVLFRIQQHLATARLHINNYNSFLQKIELIHAEVSTLLELFHPYGDDDFSEIYAKALIDQIPPSLHKYTRAYLGKTAINSCAAILSVNPDANRTYSDGLYFEEMFLTGITRNFKSVIQNAPPKSIDLYFGQFNPNIEIDHNFTHYEKRDIIKDIQALLQQSLAADHLTVAIDCTIDQIPSCNVHSLLQTFEQEIESGKLNFIFFESGLKLAQFGMDNYAGSPFYLVNNGAKHWEKFNAIANLEAHKTDSLSNQWFCIAYDKLLEPLKLYRKLIFDNTRAILDAMPSAFCPDIRVNTAAPDMDTAFIDIKVSGNYNRTRSLMLLGELYDTLIKSEIRIHQRASFGFYHANANIIEINTPEAVKTIRLTVGVNPDENSVLIQFFERLSVENLLPSGRNSSKK